MVQVENVIGFIVGKQTPWIAQSPAYRHPSESKMAHHKIRAMRLKQSKLKLFKVVCVLEGGQEIYAPKVKQIRSQNTEFGHCSLVTWEFFEVELQQPITIIKTRIVDDLGFLVVKHLFYSYRCCKPKDIIQLRNISISLS